MIIEQILVTGMAVFCYLIGDEKTGEAILVDPAGDFDKIFAKVDLHKFKIKYVVNTHGHYDHTSGNDYVIKKTGAKLLIHEAEMKGMTGLSNKVMNFFSGVKSTPDPLLLLKDGDEIKIGGIAIKVIHTPGHTAGGVCLYIEGNIFTGDTLFVEGMGRTDLPGGSERVIMDSIRNKILSLPDDTKIWPGHHYGRTPTTTVREQKRYY